MIEVLFQTLQGQQDRGMGKKPKLRGGVSPESPTGAGEAARQERRGAGPVACALLGRGRPSGLLETRRIGFRINEIWVHTFTFSLPALMLF